MEFLNRTYLGNTPQEWLVAIALAALIFIVSKIVLRLLVKRLGALAQKTETVFDDLIVEILKRTHVVFLLVAAVYTGSLSLSIPPGFQQVTNTVLVIIVIVQGALWGSAAISFWLGYVIEQRKTKDAAAATTLTGLTFVGKLVLWSVALLMVLENLGVNITALVAGLGIGGIAVALALQNVLGDLFASLSILLDKPFVIGDFIIVDQYLGTIEHIGLKTTRIRSLSGEQVVFSNADLLGSRIRNFKRMYERRVVFSIGVTYQTPYEKLEMISTMLRKIIESKQNTRFDRAHFKEYGDSALVYEVVYFVLSPEFNTYMDIHQAINLEIYRRFDELGISFAYPTRTLYVQNDLSSSEAQEVQSRGAKQKFNKQ